MNAHTYIRTSIKADYIMLLPCCGVGAKGEGEADNNTVRKTSWWMICDFNSTSVIPGRQVGDNEGQ